MTRLMSSSTEIGMPILSAAGRADLDDTDRRHYDILAGVEPGDVTHFIPQTCPSCAAIAKQHRVDRVANRLAETDADEHRRELMPFFARRLDEQERWRRFAAEAIAEAERE